MTICGLPRHAVDDIDRRLSATLADIRGENGQELANADSSSSGGTVERVKKWTAEGSVRRGAGGGCHGSAAGIPTIARAGIA
ncbi:hypothetical protein KHC23_02085 [Ancylobacter dichloromethanicus]|uniref:Uncharacterized protein n=1 Tax=Ancylobacter dichloromethanicus TaxID=518825 RepID=A0A9W6JB16_9HYPH|nr:hypothetical protein [Ancylobacter dichloromethanicus]MBS7552449.1 hypothetical protein [Ancylobacter dichloromethanicus]GLK74191.1 hypothetical protein GCM10017643_43090 [Ancylobacter dichloromethanicus]